MPGDEVLILLSAACALRVQVPNIEGSGGWPPIRSGDGTLSAPLPTKVLLSMSSATGRNVQAAVAVEAQFWRRVESRPALRRCDVTNDWGVLCGSGRLTVDRSFRGGDSP